MDSRGPGKPSSPSDAHERSSGGDTLAVSLLQLHLLVAVADRGSFGLAAQQVNLLPSDIERRLQDLAQALGMPLLRQERHDLWLTPDGQAMAQLARAKLRALDAIDGELAGLVAGTRGEVRLAASGFTLLDTLPEALARFRTDCPAVTLACQSLSSQQVISALAEHRIDVGIFATPEIPPAIEAAVYRHDSLTVLVPGGHPLSDRPSLRLRDVASFTLIGPPPGTETERLLRHHARREGLALQVSAQVESLNAMVLLAQSGLGLGIAPSRVSLRLGPFRRMRQIPLAEPWSERPLYVGILAATPPTAAARTLYRHLGTVNLPKNAGDDPPNDPR